MAWDSINAIWESLKTWIGLHPNLNSVLLALGWSVKFIGGFGGIVFLVQLLFTRPRLAIRRLTEKYSDQFDQESIRFEAENLGEKTSSILPHATLTAYSIKAKPVRYVASSNGTSRDRSMDPRVPKTYEFYFSTDERPSAFLLLKKYTFRLSHRAKRSVYMFTSPTRMLGPIEYWASVLLCIIFGERGLEILAGRKNRK